MYGYPGYQQNAGYAGYQQQAGGYANYAAAPSMEAAGYGQHLLQGGGGIPGAPVMGGYPGFMVQQGGGSGGYQQTATASNQMTFRINMGAGGAAPFGWGRPQVGGFSYCITLGSQPPPGSGGGGFNSFQPAAVPGFTVPAVQQAREQWGQNSQVQAPPAVRPPPSMQCAQMDAMLTSQNLQMMQWKMMQKMGIISDSEEECQDDIDHDHDHGHGHGRKKRDRRRQKKRHGKHGGDEDDERREEEYYQEEEEEEEEEENSASPPRKGGSKRRVPQNEEEAVAEQKRLEEKAKQAADALSRNQELKEKMKNMFIEELLSKQEAFGTFDATSGTVKELVKYAANDPVCIFYKEARNRDLTGKPWDAEADCEYLRKGMKGAGTNDDAIVSVVSTRSNAQRQQLKTMFKSIYGRDLIEDLHSELSGDYRESIMAAFVSPAEYDAWAIKEAIYGGGTDEATLIEILMTRTNDQIRQIQRVYGDVASPSRKVLADKMDKDIIDDTSGDFKRLLRAAAMGNRRMITRDQLEQAVEEVVINNIQTGMYQVNYAKLVDQEQCKQEAQQLFDAGEERWGTDEETFIRIFSRRNYYELRAIWTEYVKLAQRDILNSVDRETSGDFERGLLGIITNIRCRPLFFAERLCETMKGAGTDDRKLIRVIISRSEIDMTQIKQCFLEKTKQTLWRWIGDDCRGHYKKLLQAIVGRD